MRWTSLVAALLAASSIGCGAAVEPAPQQATVPALSSQTVLFDELFVGTQAERTLTVSNPGDTELRIVSIGWSAREVPVFSTRAQPFVLAPLGSAEVKVLFQPHHEGDHRATLELIPAGGPALEVDVIGSAVRGACEIEQELIDFGVVAAGARAQASLRVENTGRRAWRADVQVVQPLAAFRFADTRSDAPRQLSVGDEVILPVEFVPAEPGEFSAVVTVTAPEACGTRAVVLKGTAVERLVVASAEQVDFGYVEPGVTGRARLRLSNAGATERAVAAVTLEGRDAGAFSLLSSLEGQKIRAGGELEFELAFSPLQLEAHQATLLIDVAEPGRAPLAVALAGHGGGPRIVLPSPSLDFGVVALGTGQARAIVLRNGGTDVPATEEDNLRLVSAGRARMPVISDGGEGEFSLEPGPEGYTARGLAAGESAAVIVRFNPRSPGRKTARVSIWTNDPERPVLAITVQAYARELPACDLEVSPASLDFGMLRAGTEREVTVTVRNRAAWAAGTCSVFRVELGALSASAFSIDGEQGPFELAPGEERTITLRVTATEQGTFEGRLELSSSGLGASEIRIPLTATVKSF